MTIAWPRSDEAETPLKILVVAERVGDRALFRQLLSREEGIFEIIEAASSGEGLELGRNRAVDCIVLDCGLSDAQCGEFIEALTLSGRKLQPAVVLVTGPGYERPPFGQRKPGSPDTIARSNILGDGFFIQCLAGAIERSRLRHELIKCESYQQDLEKSNQALSDFAHTVSHDLKAPLRRIISYCDLLNEDTQGTLSGETVDHMERLVANARRMQRFVDDLLIFSRVMHAEEEHKETDLNAVVARVVEDLDPLIEENKALVTVDPLPVMNVYPQRIRQAFLNLMSNAIKYRGKTNPTVHVSASVEADRVVFSIQDNGIGIAPQYQHNIFKAFQRLHAQDEIEGTGLGLSIVQKVVNMHGGETGVESEAGKGARFYFSIPKELPKNNGQA